VPAGPVVPPRFDGRIGLRDAMTYLEMHLPAVQVNPDESRDVGVRDHEPTSVSRRG